MNKTSLILVIGIILSFCITLALFNSQPLSSLFSTWNEKSSGIQALYTFLGFWVAVIGVIEILKKINKKIQPDLLINGKKEISIQSLKFPHKETIHFLIDNKGDVPLSVETTCHVLIPTILKHANLTSKHKNSSGNIIVPSMAYHAFMRDLLSIGGELPARVHPKRKSSYFNIDLEFPSNGTYEILYYFVTDNGFFPEGIKADANNEPYDNLGKLKIIVQ